jgi:hypothetical protein
MIKIIIDIKDGVVQSILSTSGDVGIYIVGDEEKSGNLKPIDLRLYEPDQLIFEEEINDELTDLLEED